MIPSRFAVGTEPRTSDGLRIHAAKDSESGLSCEVFEPLAPEAAEALRARDKVLKHLSHAGLPRWLGLFESDGTVLAAREAPEGKSLAEMKRAGQPLAGFEAAAILREAAGTLLYLHSFFPPAAHGQLSGEKLVVGAAGKVWLLDPTGEGTPTDDVRALCETLRDACSPSGKASLEALWRGGKPPPTASALISNLKLLRLDASPTPVVPPRKRALTLARNTALLAATLIGTFMLGIKVRFEWYPEWSTKRDWAASLQAYKDFNCSNSKSPPVTPNTNLLENPGLEGPCGWRGKPVLARHIARRGSRSGKHHLKLGAKEWVTQEVEFPSGQFENCCDVTFRGWLKGSGAAGFELVAIVGGGAEQHVAGAGFNGSKNWTQVSGRGNLPPWTRKLKLYLDGNRTELGWFNATEFDDVELILHVRGAAAN